MSKIKINCPQCKQEVTAEKAELNRTQGRVDCPHCSHVFHLVKKPKKTANEATQTQTSQTKQPAYREPLADDAHDVKAMFDDASSGSKQKPRNKKTPLHENSNKTVLAYRIPKAPNRNKMFAEVGNDKTFAFNLLDRESVNAQLPQVSVKPASNVPMPVPVQQSGEQQNNITIHTDSLVFTLMGDGQNPLAGLTQPQMLPSTHVASNNMVATVPAPMTAVATAQNETNWTIATIAALVVLILQLFYLILMLI